MNASLEELLDEVKQTQREALRQANLLAKVRAGVAEAHVRGPLARRGRALFALAAAGGLAAMTVVLLRPAPLTIAVGDPPTAFAIKAGAVIEAAPTGQVPMRFGDGTVVALAPQARVAVAAVGAHGATLRLDRGRLGVGVVHRPGARWSVHAGPFEVKVTGTEFDVTFDPALEVLTVEMRRGSVVVSGPGIPEGTRLGAGQILSATGHDRHYSVGAHAVAPVIAMAAPVRAAAPAPVEATPAEEPAPAAPAPMHFAPAHASRAFERGGDRADRADRGWADLAAGSRYREALSAAEHVGFTSLCGRLDVRELVLLGDVARLAGNGDRAEEAYLAARRRFPEVDRPVFAMGLVAFEHRRRFHEAATWFQTYLESYPRGPLAREAAGRLIESWQRAGEPAEAARAAREYLAKYPSGPHAALARSLAAGN